MQAIADQYLAIKNPIAICLAMILLIMPCPSAWQKSLKKLLQRVRSAIFWFSRSLRD